MKTWAIFSGWSAAFAIDAGDRLGLAQRARRQAAQQDLALVIVVCQVGHQQLRGRIRIDRRAGQVLDDGLEQRLQMTVQIVRVERRPGRSVAMV